MGVNGNRDTLHKFLFSAHIDPKFWKDPDNLRPERFLDKYNKIIDSHRVISFGLGMYGVSISVSDAKPM